MNIVRKGWKRLRLAYRLADSELQWEDSTEFLENVFREYGAETVSEERILQILYRLSQTANVLQACDADGYSLLGKAIIFGHTEVLNFILKRGYNINKQHKNEWALHLAAFVGRVDIVSTLLKHGADIRITGTVKVRSGRLRFSCNPDEIPEQLLSIQFLPVREMDMHIWQTPAYFAVCSDQAGVLELLIDAAQKYWFRPDYSSLVHTACRMGSLRCLHLLATVYVGEVNRPKFGIPPVVAALRSGKNTSQVIDTLKNHGADMSPLHLVAENQKKNALHYVFDSVDNFYIIISGRNMYELIAKLLSMQISVNQRDFSGCTPLHILMKGVNSFDNGFCQSNVITTKDAIRFLRKVDAEIYRTTKLLISHGSDLNMRCHRGKTALITLLSSTNYLWRFIGMNKLRSGLSDINFWESSFSNDEPDNGLCDCRSLGNVLALLKLLVKSGADVSLPAQSLSPLQVFLKSLVTAKTYATVLEADKLYLSESMMHDFKAIVDFLLQCGTGLECENSVGPKPLSLLLTVILGPLEEGDPQVISPDGALNILPVMELLTRRGCSHWMDPVGFPVITVIDWKIRSLALMFHNGFMDQIKCQKYLYTLVLVTKFILHWDGQRQLRNRRSQVDTILSLLKLSEQCDIDITLSSSFMDLLFCLDSTVLDLAWMREMIGEEFPLLCKNVPAVVGEGRGRDSRGGGVIRRLVPGLCWSVRSLKHSCRRTLYQECPAIVSHIGTFGLPKILKRFVLDIEIPDSVCMSHL